MRPQQQNRRMRGRNNNNSNNNSSNNNNNRGGKGNQNPLTRSYESNGPDVKIRGNAQQIAEKYSTLARDAQSSGDRVMAENYLQHAEHYNRIIAAAQAQMPIQNFQQNRDDFDDDSEDRDDADAQGNNGAEQTEGNYGSGPQPVIDGVPAEVALNGENGGQGEGQPRQRDGFRNRDRRDRNRDFQNRNGNGDQPRRDFQREEGHKPAPEAAAVEQSPVEDVSDSLPAFVTAAIPAIAVPEAEPEAAPRVRKPRKPRKAADAPAEEVVAAAEE